MSRSGKSKDGTEAVQGADAFDPEWYVATYPDVKLLGMDPAEHYRLIGAKLNRLPSRAAAEAIAAKTGAKADGVARPLPAQKAEPAGKRGAVASSAASAKAPQTAAEQRIVVYSVLVGDYEAVKEPAAVDARARYLLFTDNAKLKSEKWEVVPLDKRGLDSRRASRLPKLLPHRYLPEHDVSLYLDASLTLREGMLATLVKDCLQGKDLAAYAHFARNCTYAEIDECLRLGKAEPAAAEQLRKRLQSEGFPKAFGLLENAFLLRRDSESVRALNEDWHRLYSEGAERDQFYLMYLLWKRKLPYAVIRNSKNFRQSPYVKFTSHNSPAPASGQGQKTRRLIDWHRKASA